MGGLTAFPRFCSSADISVVPGMSCPSKMASPQAVKLHIDGPPQRPPRSQEDATLNLSPSVLAWHWYWHQYTPRDAPFAPSTRWLSPSNQCIPKTYLTAWQLTISTTKGKTTYWFVTPSASTPSYTEWPQRWPHDWNNLQDLIPLYGPPRRILTDNGPPFYPKMLPNRNTRLVM